jgi:hypothetical protein
MHCEAGCCYKHMTGDVERCSTWLETGRCPNPECRYRHFHTRSETKTGGESPWVRKTYLSIEGKGVNYLYLTKHQRFSTLAGVIIASCIFPWLKLPSQIITFSFDGMPLTGLHLRPHNANH